MRLHATMRFALPLLAIVGIARDAAAQEPGQKPDAEQEQAGLDAEQCVALALQHSAQVTEADAKVKEFEARLAEVQSIYYPKLMATTWVAPMFSVHGDASTPDVTRSYKSLGDWGPYAFLQGVLAQPLYTFGRAEAGAQAASERAEVERARSRETRNVVALETRKMYALRLYARSLLPALRNGLELINGAVDAAQAGFESGDGTATQVDVAKLRYAQAELRRYLREAEDGADLAYSALKHTMGLADAYPLALPDTRLMPLGAVLPELPQLFTEAAQNRPEWTQLRHGKTAAAAWQVAEAKANWPVVFLAGMLRAAWAPTRDDAKNPYHFDPYNEVFAGVAVGLQFDTDPARATARTEVAEATALQIEALERFASTGIPLQVQKARQQAQRTTDLVPTVDQGVKATRQWLTFAAAAYKSGTGEARDLVEGLIAHLQAKKAYYDVLRDQQQAFAELAYAVGRSEHGTF